MKTVYVAFPVLRGARRFFIEKGRRWSVLEHLLLDAVCRAPASAAELAAKSCVPRRVVVEALIRLMRTSWVELIAAPAAPLFQATALGRAKVHMEHLPAITVTEPKWRGFAIELVTGGVFRSRELDVRPKGRLPISNDEQVLVQLEGSPIRDAGDLGEVFTAIEGEDELIVGVDKSPEKLLERYAVVAVHNDMIEGLPSRASGGLRRLILEKAKEAATVGAGETASADDQVPAQVHSDQAAPDTFISRDALYDAGDLLVDGEAHRVALEAAIRGASERLIIHSTFITDNRATAILPLLLQAADRGVVIDVLWGQDDVGNVSNSSREAASKLQAAVTQAGRSDSITIHPFSTNSHAKIVVADKAKSAWIALVGSCNWLASDFSSFEASVRLREPAMVGAVIRKLASLSRGRPGVWHDFAIDLTVLGRRVEEITRGNGRRVPMRIVFGSDHARLSLEARDRAKKRIFVLSHRIGIAARPVILLPVLAAAKANAIEASFYYGRTTGPLSGIDGAELAQEFAGFGLEIRPIQRPRLHAKVFGWDDDVLAVSSLNWLSADPSDASPYREIGVLIEAPKLADDFLRRFQLALSG